MRAYANKFTVRVNDDMTRIDFFDNVDGADTPSGSVVIPTSGMDIFVNTVNEALRGHRHKQKPDGTFPPPPGGKPTLVKG